jgi:hypothetical protein
MKQLSYKSYISKCGYLNRYHTYFGTSWRTFCGISRTKSIYSLPYNPNYHYVSSSFFKAAAHHLIRITHTRSKVCRSSPQKLPENASIQQK